MERRDIASQLGMCGRIWNDPQMIEIDEYGANRNVRQRQPILYQKAGSGNSPFR